MVDHPLTSPPIGAAELQKLLNDIDPAALLVSPRLLRRIIKQDRHISGVGLQVPHRKTYTIGREALLAIADRGELGLTDQRQLPDRLILLACPENWLVSRSREQALIRFWRLLFHARIDLALEEKIAQGKLTPASMRALLHRLGFVEAEEAFRVLRHENFLLPPEDLAVCVTEFISLFFELRYFARPLLRRYFPGIEDLWHAEAILSEVLDVAKLYQTTRLAGAPDPVMNAPDIDDEPGETEEELPPPLGMPSAARCQKLLAQADRVAQRGNVVRSALLRLRAADVAPPELLDAARQGAMADLERLVTRLQAALELHDREAEEWVSALRALLGPASRGIWPPSARLLYDLQKVCVDHERDLYALDMVEWMVSLFRKPIKRPVPLQADVLLVKHLRSAASRLSRARISDEDRRRLAILLRSAIHHCEERLREKVRPILAESLEEVGFKPENEAERVALRKIVEELLDRVTESGFLNMGHVRDAISRNQLKLSDVTPGELIMGDRLLKANRRLSITLDGVFHRGEIYLRWLQRFSSLLFGTLPGRWLTLYLLLPFGGAFALIVFWDEMVHLGQASVKLLSRSPAAVAPQDPPEDPEWQAEWDALWTEAWIAHLPPEVMLEWEMQFPEVPPPPPPPAPKKHKAPSLPAIAGWGVFLFLLMHAPPFRRKVWQGTRVSWHGLHTFLILWPNRFFRLPGVVRFLESRPVAFLRHRLLVPLLLALAVSIAWRFLRLPGPLDDFLAFGVTLILAFVILGSRLGRHAEEVATDWLARNWYWLRVEAIRGFIALIIYFFKEVMDRMERLLYTVDEWLRFRPGDSKLALFYKPILGLVWFALTYVIRIVINLMVEPTINPIKHFPAVTVGAKLIIPLIPAWSIAMTNAMSPFVGVWLAGTLAGTLIILIPGVFGFAAWELKENWRLYKANRRLNLSPVMIGHHGETMLRFMKPGFHSGTLPKLYAKLRRAERQLDGRKTHKQHEALHHVCESVKHFTERELIFLLEHSRAWGGLRLLVGEVKAATNRVRIELRCPDLDESGTWIVFEERSGWLVASVQKPGWLWKLSAAQASAFTTALAGLYKKAGVSLIQEQVESCFPAIPWTMTPRYLVTFPDGTFAQEEAHSLVESDEAGSPTARVPLDRLLYSRLAIGWEDWVRVWQNDHAGQEPTLPQIQGIRLLPEKAGAASLPAPVSTA